MYDYYAHAIKIITILLMKIKFYFKTKFLSLLNLICKNNLTKYSTQIKNILVNMKLLIRTLYMCINDYHYEHK